MCKRPKFCVATWTIPSIKVLTTSLCILIRIVPILTTWQVILFLIRTLNFTTVNWKIDCKPILSESHIIRTSRIKNPITTRTWLEPTRNFTAYPLRILISSPLVNLHNIYNLSIRAFFFLFFLALVPRKNKSQASYARR